MWPPGRVLSRSRKLTDRRAGETHRQSGPRAPSPCACTLTLVMQGGNDAESGGRVCGTPPCYLQLSCKSKKSLTLQVDLNKERACPLSRPQRASGALAHSARTRRRRSRPGAAGPSSTRVCCPGRPWAQAGASRAAAPSAVLLQPCEALGVPSPLHSLTCFLTRGPSTPGPLWAPWGCVQDSGSMGTGPGALTVQPRSVGQSRLCRS